MSEGELADIALIGLAVMGQNLVLNMNDHGFKVCVYNRTVSKVDEFLNDEAKGTNVIGSKSLEDMVTKLKTPRRIMVLVKAGKPVDDFIEKLVPLLSPGDIIIDGGNSEYVDSVRREKSLREKGLYFVGSGVSGGEEGARRGPSLMPGGSPEAWPFIKDIFQSIAAKVDNQPCCDWVGSGGSGHFVKMVHNGIEYGDMQLICEAYQLLKSIHKLSNDEMAKVFDDWNKGELESFLVEIARDILSYKDKDGVSELDKIYDSAGQKGTGKWTVACSLDYGIPLTLIGEAVQARCLSAMKKDREVASAKLTGPSEVEEDAQEHIDDIKRALYASKIISYAQGFALMKHVSEKLGWELNLGAIALMWRGGCIIRSKFLGAIKDAYDRNSRLSSLLLDDFFKRAMHYCLASWTKVINSAAKRGIPTPAFSSALSFYNGYKSEWIPSDSFQRPLVDPTLLQPYSGMSTSDKPEHFVEMLCHGIEYGNMQLMFESYHLFKQLLNFSDDQLLKIYEEWCNEVFHSVAVERFREILRNRVDDPTRDYVKDNSSKWTVMCSLDYGMPLTVLSQAVQSNYLSLLKSERLVASNELKDPQPLPLIDNHNFITKIKRAVYASIVISYAQGFMLMREVDLKLGWHLNLGTIAPLRSGDLRSELLNALRISLERDPKLKSILFDDYFKNVIETCQNDWREVVTVAFNVGIPIPTLSSALSFYDGYRTEKLPANLIQALRDYFGAHTYSLLGAPDVFIHTDWTGRGGRVTATTYNS